jgi:hypothetical protein
VNLIARLTRIVETIGPRLPPTGKLGQEIEEGWIIWTTSPIERADAVHSRARVLLYFEQEGGRAISDSDRE